MQRRSPLTICERCSRCTGDIATNDHDSLEMVFILDAGLLSQVQPARPPGPNAHIADPSIGRIDPHVPKMHDGDLPPGGPMIGYLAGDVRSSWQDEVRGAFDRFPIAWLDPRDKPLED